jgi:UDP-GlcNAc:undecaprenyl-phosphate/decaprenyl-phosphate GlcNAc-1-phosphate transferase
VQISPFGIALRIPFSLMLFVGALVLAWAAAWLVRTAALRLGALDHPGPRRQHEQPVPTLGGLAIAFAVLGVAWAAYLGRGPVSVLDPGPLIGLTLASIPILALGVIDDLRGLHPLAKLAFQATAALILVGFGLGVPEISTPWGGGFSTGLFNVPLTIVWVLVVTNAINLIDGLDGLAAGAVAIAAMTLWWVGRTHTDLYVMFLTAAIAGASVGFLFLNFPPAKIFMGDTGSQFLGLMLAAASLIDNRKGTATVTLIFPLVAMGIPLVDTALAFIRRAATGRPVFVGDSEHIHHRLLRLGLSKARALFVLWYLCAYLGVMAIVLAALPRHYTWFVVLLLVMGVYLAFEVLEFVDRRSRGRGPEEPPR